MRRAWLALVAVVLAACSSTPARHPVTAVPPGSRRTVAAEHQAPARPSRFSDACAPTRQHRDSDYTPGGLYAPGVADGGPSAPIDVSGVREPVPRTEPRSRYGNRSPYSVLGQSYRVLDSAQGYHERGVASWYGTKFNGRATSSGELYDMCVFSAAHKTLPLPSFVRVTNLDNGRSLIVRVNDRGPFHSGRIMDLSYAAAVRLGVDRTGTARVELEAVGDGDASAPAERFAQTPRAEDEPENLREITELSEPEAGATTSGDAESTPRPGSGELDGAKLVQVGSFGEQDNARRLVERLRDEGVADVAIDRAEVSGQPLWRGPVPAGEVAELLQHLRRLDLPDPRVVSE